MWPERIRSQAYIERLATNAGVETLFAAIELLAFPFLLVWAPVRGLEMVLLAVWSIIWLVLIVANTRWRSAWAEVRLSLTSEGECTPYASGAAVPFALAPRRGSRIAALRGRIKGARPIDAGIEAGLPRGYVLAALAVMAPSFLAGSATL